MNDERLVAEVARVWVDGGGDVDGIAWCYNRIREAVAEETAARAQQEDDA